MDTYNDDCIAHELLDLKNGLCAVFTGQMIDFFIPKQIALQSNLRPRALSG